MFNLKLRGKMAAIGVVAVIALSILFAIVLINGNSISANVVKSHDCQEKLHATVSLEMATESLLLAAMDAIVDREGGDVDAELMDEITGNSRTLLNHIPELKEIGEFTGKEAVAATAADEIHALTQAVQKDLIALIRSSGSVLEKVLHDFAQIDDVLDTYGDGADALLAEVETALKEKPQADLRYVNTVTELRFSLNAIMLAAMDAIIDRHAGIIDKELMDDINGGFEEIEASSKALEEACRAAGKMEAYTQLNEDFASLKQGIKTDLVQLIQSSAKQEAQTKQAFAQMDDDLDVIGHALMENLESISVSIEHIAEQAQEDMTHAVSASKTGSLITWIVCSVLLVVILLAITKSITRPLIRSISALTDGGDQVSGASRQVASASQSLAEGASEQAAGLEETSSSLEEMTSMTKQTATNARQANVLAEETKEAADAGSHSMERMNGAINDIQKSATETAKIIKVIDEIAFQTNLLALNAAVEAARAGEAGKGFAVVAEEVRNLAKRSAEAAKETSALIEQSVQNAQNGVQISEEVTGSLANIVTNITKTTGLVSEITAATDEQAQGINEINSAVSQMDQVTQANAANAEESASASEELNTQAEQLQAVVKELAGLIYNTGTGSATNTAPEYKPEPRSKPKPEYKPETTSRSKRPESAREEKEFTSSDATSSFDEDEPMDFFNS